MWTYIGTHITLDTFLTVPYRNVNCDTTFLIFGGSLWHGSIWQIHKLADRNVVTLHGIYRDLDVLDPFWKVLVHLLCLNCDVCPSCRYFYLFYHLNTLIHSGVVHVDDLLALLAVGF